MTCAITTALLTAVLALAPFGGIGASSTSEGASTKKTSASCSVPPEECKKVCPEGAAKASSAKCTPEECEKVCPGGAHQTKKTTAAPKKNPTPQRS